MVKNLPAVQETWVQSLSQEDPLRREYQIRKITVSKSYLDNTSK